MESWATSADRSINGLVVFLTLSVFLAVLTSGLIVCLLKIWCGHKRGRRQTLAEQQLPPLGVCPNQESDSDEEPISFIRAPAVRRFSQRIVNLVQRSSDKRPIKEGNPENLPVPPLHIHGATDDSSAITIRSNPVDLSINDPSCVIHL